MKTYLLFTDADNEIQAIDFAEAYLEGNFYKGIYSKNYVVTGNCYKLSDISAEYIENRLKIVEEELNYQRKREEECRANGDRRYEGRAAYAISKILRETMCKDMPWFNLMAKDWSVPPISDEKFLSHGSGYYAVEVELEFVPDYPLDEREREKILSEIKPLT